MEDGESCADAETERAVKARQATSLIAAVLRLLRLARTGKCARRAFTDAVRWRLRALDSLER
jgi:ribosomal protein L30/L7E